ncbi:MAG: FtsX-like permease family protein [Clostridia bacterium]|nr:FtsX-like permease family protein [Clostridia bacterium]
MSVTTFPQLYAKLRHKSRSQYALLAACCFFSTLLITAYVLMMRSPTVLTVLPEGGDSRKQMMMIFVLTVIGCGVFTAYASGLFFRYKSRECGIFLALGATKSQLAGLLRRELAALALFACGAGLLLGGPLSWLVWRLFRLLVVDTAEMVLSFDRKAYGIALAFFAYVLIMLFGMLYRFLRRTNILDIISESRRSEPVRNVPLWYGAAGICLVALGTVLGYQVPSFCVTVLQWYPPEVLTAIFYLPALIGLYMILLHTVVNGWRRGKNRYAHLVTTSMMRFQGRQTVRNLLVVTVLVAGAYFAAFYAPILGVSSYQGFDARKADYAFHYRADQSLPTQQEIQALAKAMDVTLTNYAQQPGAILAYDGEAHVEAEGKMGVTYTTEYREQLSASTFLSESAWNALTGGQLQLAPGTVVAVYNDIGDSGGMVSNDISLVTNPITGKSLSVIPVEPVLCNSVLFGRRVLDDGDYAVLSAGLPDDWREEEVVFNVQNVESTYAFAKALFYEIVDRSGPEVELFDAWDPVQKMQADAAGEAYSYDKAYIAAHGFESIDYALRDSSNFRLAWKYMPQFRILDKMEFIKTMAVYLMLFIFIAVLCFAAVFVILYTRCMTIALCNASVYDDLRHLGASNRYLFQTVRQQIKQVFFVPILTGTTIICAFYCMILYFNDDKLSYGELSGMAVCALLIASISVLLYGFYRYTRTKVCGRLNISVRHAQKR